jgi:undecaprenyl diphosphate synthase
LDIIADMAGKTEAVTLPPGTKVPDHIALILDGNRRWARARGKPTLEGHLAGFNAGMKVAQAARDWGVHTFTVWGFSTENWDRSREEIDYLMTLYWKMVDEVRNKAKKDGIRFVHLGRKDRFPADLVKHITEVEDETRQYAKHVFNAALDYGGHDEILRAVNKILDVRSKMSDKREVTEKEFAGYLDTGDQPYPYVDLFIRTSGEQRTSGLLPWQMCYAEYYWELEHLPDMTPEKLRDSILDYSRRRRRFGGNDKEEHLKFNPKLVARLELDFRRAMALGANEKLRDIAIAYVKEQYGLSKELAVTAGVHMASALIHQERSEWLEAKKALKDLFEVVKKNLGLAMEPELVADLQIRLWQNGSSEENLRKLYSETYRVSDFQASKSAHLAYLANNEISKNNFAKAKGYLEKFYAALKERVA